ncbi:MAG: ABC transporter substrate-binding protein [Deltaproteobacteria bacterium]|nr:ABC transporter substrate-binding protein [Deltaproteobacteria bacterium]
MASILIFQKGRRWGLSIWVCAILSVVFILGVFTAPASAKTLVVAMAGDVAHIDHVEPGSQKWALCHIYDWQWTRYKTVELPGGTLTVDTEQIVPGIITHIDTEAQPDGTAIKRFHVRPNAVHHSGNPIIAEDFKWTILRRAGLGRDFSNRFLGGLYHIKEGLEDSIKIIDDHTFEVKVKKDMPLFGHVWEMRSYFDSKLAKAHATKKDPWAKAYLAKNDAGAGPYTLEKWDVGNEMVLKKFDRYWGPPPAIDQLVFRTVPDLSSRVLLLKNGDVDVALNIPLRELQTIKNSPGVKVISAPSTTTLYVGMNPKMPPFDSKDFRLALTYAFPYEDIIPGIFQGAAQPLNGPIPTGMKGALKERRYKTDLALAKEHLKKAGMASGLKLTLKWQTGFPQYSQIGVLFAENLKKIGVDLKLQQLPVGQFQSGMRSRTLDFFIHDGLAWIRKPEFVANIYFTGTSSTNPTGYANERVDDLIHKALAEPDTEKRSELVKAAQEIILEDVPWIFIAQPDFQLAMRSNIVGYVSQNTELHHFWLVDKQ